MTSNGFYIIYGDGWCFASSGEGAEQHITYLIENGALEAAIMVVEGKMIDFKREPEVKLVRD